MADLIPSSSDDHQGHLPGVLNALSSCLLCILLLTPTPCLSKQPSPHVLAARNGEVPFSYLAGKTRRWPILTRKLAPGQSLTLTGRRGATILGRGPALLIDGLKVTIDNDGFLRVVAPEQATSEFKVDLVVSRAGTTEQQQQISLRPAPPDRPISYVADLVDDLIRIYWDGSSRRFRPLTKDGFDQYFRRLQAQGITRLIVWQSAFPLIADATNYRPQDWRRFELQARAILDSQQLTENMRQTPGLKNYQWLGLLMQLRLNRDFDRMFTQSARDHQVRLTASYRPFEAALTKYYEIPCFAKSGGHLWNFLPAASPTVNYQADKVGFAHYREVLRRMDKGAAASLSRIEIGGIVNPQALATRLAAGKKDLTLVTSPVPPLDPTSFVLVRHAQDQFKLAPYASIREQVEKNLHPLENARFRIVNKQLVIDQFQLPASSRYLWLRAASDYGKTIVLPVIPSLTLRASAGNRLGRGNVYTALSANDTDARLSQISGITPSGRFQTEFQAIEASIDYFRKRKQTTWNLGEGTLVIDRGEPWTVEILDFNRAATRRLAVNELKTILKHEAFDEIFINTRSHTQLSGSTGDGVDGIRTMAHYRVSGKNYFHYGIDRAFGPIAMASNPQVQALPVEQITTWQRGEWQGPCQAPGSPFVWRYQRNREVAKGMRSLLSELQEQFPGTRIRAVIPQGESVIRETETALETMPKPGKGVYGRSYFRHIWGSLNYIPAIGEGMAMVDLSGLSVEPVFLGVRYAPDAGPLNAFVDRYMADLAANRGSSFQGPKSFFYEAQETLRAADKPAKRKRREAIIYNLLDRPEVNEILLYEAADWTYYLPLSDRLLSGHGYLDRQAK